MPNRNRETLSVARLKQFEAWAATVGYASEPVKGRYEVLRLRPPTGDGPWIFYRREWINTGENRPDKPVPFEGQF